MHEKVLVWIALCTALIGIAALWFFPELPHPTINGTITWENGTHAWLEVKTQYWVTFDEAEELTRDEFVSLQGDIQGTYVSSAQLLQPDQ